MTETKEKNRQKLGIFCCIAGGVGWGLSGTCGEALFSPVSDRYVLGDGCADDCGGNVTVTLCACEAQSGF